MRIAILVLCTALLVLGIAGIARAPYTPAGHDQAWLRFSWRMTVAAKEHCRPRTQQELDALPVHMRTPEVCTPDTASYALAVAIDDQPVESIELARGGLKGDRPLFVLEQRALSPGKHRIRVAVERRNGTGTQGLAALDTTLALEHGTVQLITLAADGRTLEARTSAQK